MCQRPEEHHNSPLIPKAQNDPSSTKSLTIADFLTPVGSFPGVIEEKNGTYVSYIYGLPARECYRSVWVEYRDLSAGWSKVTPPGRMRSIKEVVHRVEEGLRCACDLCEAICMDRTLDVVHEFDIQSELFAARALATELKNRLNSHPHWQEAVARLSSQIDQEIEHRRYMLARRQSHCASRQTPPMAAE